MAILNNIRIVMFIKGLFYKYRILNFMLVGGIGYFINLAVYYPLLLVFRDEVTLFNTHFYLPPFLISTYVAATANYLLNKKLTFNGMERHKQSYIRYLLAVAVTVFFDIILLFVLVDYAHIPPELAVVLALLVMFILRYVVVKKWVWKEKKNV